MRTTFGQYCKLDAVRTAQQAAERAHPHFIRGEKITVTLETIILRG
jgi:hypothetical protein